METATTRDWGYALALLAAVSACFLGLRLYGQPLVALEFEVLVIHVPTVICLLVYIAILRFGHFSRSATHASTETSH